MPLSPKTYMFENWKDDSPNFYHAGPTSSGYYPFHVHRLFELVVVWTGSIETQVDKTRYLLGSGDALLIFPQQLHSSRVIEEGKQMTCVFAPEMIGQFTREKEHLLPTTNLLKLQASPYFEQLWSEFENEGNIYRVRSLLFYFASLAEEQLEFRPIEKATHSDQLLLSQILEFVQQNWQENCSLTRLAQTLGYDYAYLSKYFAQASGMQYTSYINHLRIFNACNQIVSSDMSVVELSEWCGYDSVRSFYRNFSAIMKCTATEYIAQNRDIRRQWKKDHHDDRVESLYQTKKWF